MTRGRLLTVLLLCTVALSTAGVAFRTAGAASATVHGGLTSAEYHQLQHAQKRIRSLVAADARSLSTAKAVCTHMRPVSRLIAAVRGGCLALVRLGHDETGLSAQATRCGIDPGSETALLSCLIPAIRHAFVDAQAFFRAESRVDRLARARGFSRSCMAVIGDSPGNIAAEGRLVHDLRAAISALRQQNLFALETLFGQIQNSVRSIKPGPRSLSLCLHQ